MNQLRNFPASRTRPKPVQKFGLGTLGIQQKFILIIVVAAIPALLSLFINIAQRYGVYSATQQERLGLLYLQQSKSLLDSLNQARQARLQMLFGQPGAAGIYQQSEQGFEDKLKALESLDQARALSPEVSQALQGLKQVWEEHQGLEKRAVFPTEYDSFFQEAVRNFPKLFEAIGNASGLVQDDDQDAFYLADLSAIKLPELSVSMGQSLNAALPLVLNRSGSPLEKAELRNLLAESRFKRDQTVRTRDLAVKANPLLDESVGISAEVYFTNLLNFVDRLDATLLQSPRIGLGQAGLLQTFSQTTNILSELMERSQSQLDQLLQARSKQLLYTMLAEGLAIFLGLALALWLVFSVARQVTQAVGRLYAASQRLAQGNLGVRVEVQGQDELAALSRTFNDMVSQLRARADADAEEMRRSSQLQTHVSEFLGVATEIAQGDLTRRGQVTEDVLGNVVDAINLMTEEIAYLLKEVSGVAHTVNSSASELDSLSALVVESAQHQASVAQKASQETTQVTQSIRQMSQSSHASAEAARQTLEASNQGQAALSDTLSGMQNVRREVQSISKNIKALSDRSLEISQIVDTITMIAKQTNLLALNAAIEAAGAGESGTRFAVVADQVRKLADDSARAASQVGALVKQIQAEIQGVVVSVEGGTKEVEQGYRIATEAAERLKQIATFASQSAQFAEFMSSATQQQVQRVEEVSGLVQTISASAVRSQVQSEQGRQSAERLRHLAEQLSQNLARFRLPA